jgi:hypothetical protein
MYLEQETIQQLLQTLRRLFPEHKLICDLPTRRFFEKYARTMHEKLAGMGASFRFTVDKPENLVVQNGYRQIGWFSIVGSAMEFESKKIPSMLANTLYRTLTRGYAIYVFASP